MAKVVDEVPPSETVVGIVSGSGEGKRAFRGIVWSLVAAAVLLVALASLRPVLWPPTLRMRADKILSLPAEAKVLGVEESIWDREGVVTYSLPEPKGPGSRLKEVWTLNGWTPLPVPIRISRPGKTPVVMTSAPGTTLTKNKIKFHQNLGDRSEDTTLSYDPVKRIYRFERVTTH